jgi:ribonuclease HII
MSRQQGRMSSGPDFSFETDLKKRGCHLIAGVDEVGRGPWAGPVTAAAVIFAADPPEGLNDSKKLTAAKREKLVPLIHAASHYAVADASVEEIDALGIVPATYLAMCRAIDALPVVPDHLLVDGNRLPPNLPCPATPIIRGDGLSASIAAASVLAKTCRDRGMMALAQQHPGYGWETNMGYGTAAHQSALAEHGVTQHHRRSFAPIHKMLRQ